MRIAIGSDHAGFFLKNVVIENLRASALEVMDFGTDSTAPVDYPDFAKLVADAVVTKVCQKGIVICGSGIGASIAANKVHGVRASVCHDTYSAHQGVEHDDMNVIAIGSRIIGECLALEIVTTFLKAQFSQEDRHVRRLNKILFIENS